MPHLHAAASFDGDETGRFCHRIYRDKDKIAWWDNGKIVHDDDGNDLSQGPITECAGAHCPKCHGRLYMMIVIDKFIVNVVE